MPQKQSWIKDNFFIVAAVALPLCVALMFTLATVLPKLYVEDPTYDLLLMIDTPQQDPQVFDVRYAVQRGKLTASVGYVDGKDNFHSRRLYRYRVNEAVLEELDVTVPETVQRTLTARADGKTRVTEPLMLPHALLELEVISGDTAPDGYRFRNQRGSGAGIFGEFFGMGGYRYVVAIERDGRVVDIPVSERDRYRYYYTNVQLLGWIAK